MLPLKDSFCRGQKKAIRAAVRKEFHLFVCLALIGFKRQGHLSIGRLDFSLPSRIQLMVRHFWARREYFGKTGEHHGYPGRINPIEEFHTSSSFLLRATKNPLFRFFPLPTIVGSRVSCAALSARS